MKDRQMNFMVEYEKGEIQNFSQFIRKPSISFCYFNPHLNRDDNSLSNIFDQRAKPVIFCISFC